MTDLDWTDITLITDTREQTPLSFGSMRVEVAGLDCGDLTVKGLEHVIRIERKSLADFVTCCGRDRDRFERQLMRLRGFPVNVVLCEFGWGDVELAQWRSKLTASQVTGSLVGFMAGGNNFILAGCRERAAKIAARLCFITARRRHRECQAFFKQVTPDGTYEIATS